MTALVLGAVTGIFFAHVNIFGMELWQVVAPLGTIFIRLLRMVVVPIVLFSLIVGTASIEPSRLGRIGTKIMMFYIGSTVVAGAMGLLFANFFNISGSISLKAGTDTGVITAVEAKPLSTMLMEIIPTNIFDSLNNINMLQIIFFAMAFGLALAFLKDSKKENLKEMGNLVFKFFSGAAETMYILVRWIMQYAPIGVFALITGVFAENGISALKPLFKYIGVLYLAFITHFILRRRVSGCKNKTYQVCQPGKNSHYYSFCQPQQQRHITRKP
ncbi:Na+/H+-dicarboxylate symporter [Elusimicrobium simillimum]